MGTIRIEQFASMALDHKGLMQMPQLPPTAPAIVIASSGVSQVSGVLAATTRFLRIRGIGTPAIAFRLGDTTNGVADPVAATTDPTVQDGEVFYFGIDPGLFGRSALKIAVIDAP